MVMASDRLVMETNETQTVEDSLTAAGTPRTFHSIKTPYCDRRGNIIGVMGISRDISAQKQAERALKMRDRAIEEVSQGILITDPNQPDNPIIYASAGLERLTGYRAEEIRVGLKKHAHNGNAIVGRGFEVFDIVHGVGVAALDDAGDPVRHFGRRDTVVGPYRAGDWNIDVREDIPWHGNDGDSAQNRDQNRHHHEGVGSAQSEVNNPHEFGRGKS